jgi:RTX calcium-binding nonapeptide repeat (4 copies)
MSAAAKRASTGGRPAWRMPLVGVALCAALAGTAAQAAAEADVTAVISTAALDVRVVGLAGADGDHGLAIRPGFDKVRVEQLAFGNPTITTPGAVGPPAVRCGDVDFLGNSVTCPIFPSTVTIRTGDGDDEVRIGPSDPAPSSFGSSSDLCFISGGASPPLIGVSAVLGPGDDTLVAVPNNPNAFEVEDTFCPLGLVAHTDAFNPVITANGGSGDDDLRAPGPAVANLSGEEGRDIVIGGDGNDVLRGGPGNDRVDGSGGNDILLAGDGNDTVSGSTGDDQIVGEAGDDSLSGNAGDDTFSEGAGPDGADTIRGGTGFDTVDYGQRGAALDVRLGSSLGDGEAGEGDEMVDVERVLGGRAGDVMVGSSGPDVLVGNGGRDTLNGLGGADTLDLGADDDLVIAVDGVRDSISCGAGTDRAILDLQDALVPNQVRLPSGATVLLPDCESVTRQAVDDSPPGRPLRARVRLSGGAAVVGFTCPRNARPRCRGRLTLRDPARPGRVLGGARYALALGTSGSVRVRLKAAGRAALRRSHLAIVRTAEHGHSRKGPRGTLFRLGVS